MDTATAATMQSLSEERLRLRCEVEAYKSLYDNACVQVAELRAENERINSRATMDREEIDSMAKRNGEMRAALDASTAREEAYRADVVKLTATVEALRANANDADLELAKAMSRAEVLEAEIAKWRAWCDAEDSVLISEPLLWQGVVNARAHTDSTNALDAGKFRVQP
jgi:chromosome segregation ATPase